MHRSRTFGVEIIGASLVLVSLVTAPLPALANPIISEVMYHPEGPLPEDLRDEWIELHNPTAAAIDLTGYQFDNGVEFTFPAVSIPAGGHLVIAADPAEFGANFPAVTDVVGPWSGKLRNSGEKLTLRDSAGVVVDEIEYADEGDWATRARGALDLGHEGWTWVADHDGGGSSLELINPSLSNKAGQNWASSLVAGGTPGAANSVASGDIAPLIREVQHRPKIPNSSDAITVRARVTDETVAAPTVTLHWRLDGAGPFTAVPATQVGDEFSATIPPQADGAIIEFFVSASDGALARDWPAEVLGGGHLANALIQVDDSHDRTQPAVGGEQGVYRVIMTEAERAELEQIGTTGSQSESNAEMNATFISADGTGTSVRYLASIRNRGASSRTGPPNNHLVKFRSDDPWDGVTSIKFNSRYVHSQVAGAWLFQRLGIEADDGVAAQLRINAGDLAESGGPRMYGSYAMLEQFDSDWTAAHFPLDGNGNLYQVRDDEATGDEGDLRYEGDDPDAYRNTYFKQTNESADDWSDLIALTDVLNNSPPETYFEEVSQHVDIDQWLRYLAVDALLGNREGGLTSAKGDDYALYSGVSDPRFRLVPHDLDTLLGQASGSSPGRSIFVYDGLDGLEEFLNHPDIVPLYYAAYLELLDGPFSSAELDPILDRALGNFVPAAKITEMKEFIPARRAGVLAQIPQTYSASTDLPQSAEGYHRTLDGSANFSGDFHAAYVRSILVNGISADLDARAGTWGLAVAAGGGGVIKPGLNRVVVEFFSGKAGAGEVLHREELSVWNDTGSMTQLSGTLTGGAPRGAMKLTARNTYLPGTPFLVRVDFRNPDGSFDRNLWETSATLSSSVPGISLSPNSIDVRNGLGTALVTVGGGAGGTPVTLLPTGSVWKYLDDGSDQGTAWRAPGFDDSTWAAGPAQLGYGDGDEDTVVGYAGTANSKSATTYFRTTFDVADASAITGLSVDLVYDDGAAIYLNGVEIAKTSNMTSDLAFDEYSDGDSPGDDATAQFGAISPALLVDGANTLAVEIKQGDGGSSDISFDLGLVGQTAGTGSDPGDFTLLASAAGQSDSVAMVSLGISPVTTDVSGTLGGGASTTWSGIVRITDDVTVPAGHTLNINPGTLILVAGTAAAQSTDGRDLIVEGAINSLGTELQPITFTAIDPAAPWGQILFSNSEGASFEWTNIHRAGHSPRGGHTNHGRVLRILGSDVSFSDCNITDHRGKVGETGAQGGSNSSMVFRRCHWARSVMGIETFDTDVLVEDCHITDMLGIYREDGVTDDNDAIYLHGAAAGQQIILRRLVVAYTDDDGIDTLNAEVVMEDVISRNCFDKGTSIFGDNVSITRGLFVDNDLGISAKDDADVTLDFVTVARNSTFGIQAENKDGDDQPSFYTISNSIVQGVDPIGTDYDPADITASYSAIGEAWPGVGNTSADPLFVDAAGGDFHLSPASPARDAADPALPDDPDGTAQEMGVFPFVSTGSEVRWTVASSPYHVTSDVTIPDGTTLVVEPGASIYFDLDTQLTINGKAQIVGTPTMRIQFSPVPGAPFVPDPAGNGSLPDGPPKWDGIRIVDSMDPDNRIAHIDVGHAQDSNGSIGIIRSQCVVDDVTFHGTHIRLFYTEESSIILENSRFPDVFGPDEQADALGLDNVSEQVKGVGSPPVGGRYIIRNNSFGTTKGHNDVVDVDSGRRPDPIVQVIGNTFTRTGDEHLDLGGDVYVAGNVFRDVFKDDETSDRGYANAISTGDAGTGTTIVVARNIFWDVDHSINLKRDTATIFENNSVFKVHPDFSDRFGNPSVASVVNLFIPTDSDPNATAGDGAYLSDNILAEVPRIFSGADDDKQPPFPTTPLEMHNTLVGPGLLDQEIGPNHPGQTVFDLGTGNFSAAPLYSDPENGDFSLLPGSPAIAAGSFGEDLGALVSDKIFIAGEPPALTTSGDATLLVGGPGIFAYRWRINGGAWSADTPIGDGFDPAGSVRQAEIVLSGLVDGTYTVEAEGQNFAGDWQLTPTLSKTWTVASSLPGSVQLSEILAVNDSSFDVGGGIFPDLIELFNPGTSSFGLGGHSLSDDPDLPTKYVFPAGVSIPAGGFLVVSSVDLGFTLDRKGESVALYDALGGLVDSIAFGAQVPDRSISRLGHDGAWGLSQATPGAPNLAARTGNPATLRISEWFANGQVAYVDDFVELSNPDPLPVPLAGLFLTDNVNSNPELFQIPALSFVEGSGFVTFDSNQLGFRLGSTMDALALLDPSLRPLDSIVFGQQAEDYSQRAMTDGGNDYIYDRLPTPGTGIPAAGTPEEAEYLRALAIYDSLRITEIMFNPSGSDEGFEFIELQNIGAVAIDLAGTRFGDGISFTFPSLVLAPGEYVVVSPDLAKFELRYGSGINVVGPYDGKLNNAGEGVLLQLPEPYDAGVLRFDYNDWFPETDGEGHSLRLINPIARRDSWDDQDSWAIGAAGGSPGSDLVIDAGSDQSIVLPATTSISATLTEGGVGVPVAGLTLTWRKVSGAGSASFSQPGSLSTGVSFSEPGTYLLALEAVGNGTFTGDQVVVTVNDTYEAWAARGGAGLPMEDDEWDGLNNLFEYALDLDPAVADVHPLSVFPTGSEILFDYTRYLRKIDLIYQAQLSDDLKSWTPAAEMVIPGGSPDTEIRRASIPASARGAFWRLSVEKP